MLIRLELSTQIFEKYLNKKFNANPSGGSRVVPREMTDMTKLTVDFQNFAYAPKSLSFLSYSWHLNPMSIAVEENIWTEEGRGNGGMEEIA